MRPKAGLPAIAVRRILAAGACLPARCAAAGRTVTSGRSTNVVGSTCLKLGIGVAEFALATCLATPVIDKLSSKLSDSSHTVPSAGLANSSPRGRHPARTSRGRPPGRCHGHRPGGGCTSRHGWPSSSLSAPIDTIELATELHGLKKEPPNRNKT